MAFRKGFVRTPFNYDAAAVSHATGVRFEKPSLTQQNMKDDCDLNKLYERFGLNPSAMPQNPAIPLAGDFTGIGSFHDALARIRVAEESFNRLPSKIRSRFENDPGKYVEFCLDPANGPELVRMGLAKAPAAPAAPVPAPAAPAAPVPVPVAPAAPAAP